MTTTDHVLQVFTEETAERLASIEAGLLKLEADGNQVEDSVVHGIFRDAHSVKAGANLLKLENVENLAHKLENILEMVRKGQLVPDDQTITILLETVDKLRELMDRIEESDTISIRLHEAMLNMIVQKATSQQS